MRTDERPLVIALALLFAPAVAWATWDLQPARLLARIAAVEGQVRDLQARMPAGPARR